jgi:hypothetical protein
VGIQSISFYQQDLNYWQQAQAQSQAQSADSALIGVMAQAEVNQAKGLASIANGTALKRVNSELTAAVQAALNPSGASTSSSSSSNTATAASSSSATSSPTPATGIGTVPLTTTATLSTLGFLPAGTFSVDDGTNITKYTSTGDDTVADLINAINSGPAFVKASINGSGKLVITARNDKEIVTVEGSGNDAAALGFGTGNNSFTPKAPSSSPSGTSSTSSASGASSTSSTSSSSATSSTKQSSGSSESTAVSSIAEETSSSAASFLSASGVSGSLVDMLA